MAFPNALLPSEIPIEDDEDSPSKRARMEDADAALDLMLERQKASPAASLEMVPAWARQLQASVDSNALQIREVCQDFHTRLSYLEDRVARPAEDPRVSVLTEKVDELTRLVHGRPPSVPMNASSGNAADPWASFSRQQQERTVQRSSFGPSSSQQSHDTDFCRVIVGGWCFDTPRRVILEDLSRLVATWSQADRSLITKQMVFGQRAQTAHLILQPCDFPGDRFYALQESYSNKVFTRSGEGMWMSPSRSPARRALNKVTKRALDTISGLWPADSPPKLETSWQRQIVWLADRRVAAGTQDMLVAQPAEKVIVKVIGKDESKFYFNVSLLATETKQTEAEIEIKVQEAS
ncbi:unnamed protein product [Symbiodinium natans]|uniref:Uncharacterized protein n=1 Tax=Symbiodinium natans TaxID=878477 RepID=A0A812I0X9_9DINO|nr:unnamed protein product [Symbiodinium natans]